MPPSRMNSTETRSIEGLMDDQLHNLLMREQLRTFFEAQNWALSLEAISKNSRKRSRRHTAAVRSVDEMRHTSYASTSTRPKDSGQPWDRRKAVGDEKESEEQQFPKMHNRMQAMEFSLKDVQTRLSKMLNSILPKPWEEPRQGRRQDRLNNHSTRIRQTVVTGDRLREQTFRTDSVQTGATTVEVTAGIVARKGT